MSRHLKKRLRDARRGGLILLVAVWQLALSTPPSATAEQISIATPPVAVWRSLHYRGKNWLGRMAAQLEIQRSPTQDDSALSPGAARGIAELRTSFDSILFANRSTLLRAIFDRTTGTIINFTKLSLGRRPDFKRFDFRPHGVDRLRLEPRSGEISLPAEQWSASHRSFYALVPGRYDCRLVSDPGAMAYLLSSETSPLSESTEESRFCFFSGKTLYRVQFKLLGSSNPKVDYQRVENGVGSNRSGRVTMDRYGVLARPVAGNLDESPIRAEILIEADTRIPWRFMIIEGWMKINVVLDEVILGEPQSTRLSVVPHGDR